MAEGLLPYGFHICLKQTTQSHLSRKIKKKPNTHFRLTYFKDHTGPGASRVLLCPVLTSSFDEWQEVSQHVSGGKEVGLEGHFRLDCKRSRVCHWREKQFTVILICASSLLKI